MELIRGIHNITPRHHGCVLTIGNFDGVHKGHQQVLQQVSEQADRLSLPSVVMTFEPQPMELFAKDKAPARLTRLRDKFVQLSKLDIDRLLCVNFNRHFASLTAEEFIRDLLVERLGVKFLVVGDDFCFGKGRTGNFAMLQEAGEKYGFDVVSTRAFVYNNYVSAVRLSVKRWRVTICIPRNRCWEETTASAVVFLTEESWEER